MHTPTGRVIITIGLDADGEEGWDWKLEDVTVYDAWATTQLVADRLHRHLMESADELNRSHEDDDEDA